MSDHELQLRRLCAEWCSDWQAVWERDDPYHVDMVLLFECFFDKTDGTLEWISKEEPEPERETAILSDPTRYEPIPPLTHAQHHVFFQAFLQTVPHKVRELCNNGRHPPSACPWFSYLEQGRAHAL